MTLSMHYWTVEVLDSIISANLADKQKLSLWSLMKDLSVKVSNGQLLEVWHIVRITARMGKLPIKLFLLEIAAPLPIVLGYQFLHKSNPWISVRSCRTKCWSLTGGTTIHRIP